MEVSEAQRIIQNEELDRDKILSGKIIIREVSGKIPGIALSTNGVFAILGIRRCGKTTYAWLLLNDKKYGYVNFDDEAFYGATAKDLDNVLKALYALYGTGLNCIVLDEVQNIEGWELFVNRLGRTKCVIITGSNSLLLSGELATHLTGRHLDLTLFPFSLREFLEYEGVQTAKILEKSYATENSAIVLSYFEKFLRIGGFPEGYIFGAERLKAIFSDIINKDIIRRHNIKNAGTINALAKYLVTNSSNEFTYNKLKNIFSVKKQQTIKNYTQYLENAYIIFTLERFSYKLKEQHIAPKKAYCADTGIMNAIGFFPMNNLSQLLETAVAIELKRRRGYWNGGEVFYWRGTYGRGVDFVIMSKGKVNELIQVTYANERSDIKERELRSLATAAEELRCDNLLLLTWDFEAMIEHKGKKIRALPAWKWLLELPKSKIKSH